MKLKVFSIAFPAAIFTILGVIAIAAWLVASSFHHVRSALEQRKVTLALTDELSDLTNKMSRLLRAYAATGDEHYLNEYYALTEYRTVMGGSGLREYLKGDASQAKSFPVRMREAGASADELKVLDQAIDASDGLHPAAEDLHRGNGRPLRLEERRVRHRARRARHGLRAEDGLQPRIRQVAGKT